jgi:hypothetical protein
MKIATLEEKGAMLSAIGSAGLAGLMLSSWKVIFSVMLAAICVLSIVLGFRMMNEWWKV